MKKVQYEVVDIMQCYWNSGTSNSPTYRNFKKWYFISLERMIIAFKYYFYHCFLTAHQNAQYIVKQTLNYKTKAKSSCYNLEEKLSIFLKPNMSII